MMSEKHQFVATIEEQANAAIADFGGLRAAARGLKIDAAYLSRLVSGEKSNPSLDVLSKLNLTGPVFYTQTAVFTACRKCDAHLLKHCICKATSDGE